MSLWELSYFSERLLMTIVSDGQSSSRFISQSRITYLAYAEQTATGES
jgi:hypothetical protein